MGSIVQNATQAVMSLPALIIQRANPGLYELLSNGVMQGRIDFDRSKLTCQAMAEKMADKVGQAGWVRWPRTRKCRAIWSKPAVMRWRRYRHRDP